MDQRAGRGIWLGYKQRLLYCEKSEGLFVFVWRSHLQRDDYGRSDHQRFPSRYRSADLYEAAQPGSISFRKILRRLPCADLLDRDLSADPPGATSISPGADGGAALQGLAVLHALLFFRSDHAVSIRIALLHDRSADPQQQDRLFPGHRLLSGVHHFPPPGGTRTRENAA